MFLLVNVTLVSERTPDAATMPNSATPAPPRTALGTPSTTAPTLGTRPSTTRMPPAIVATYRDPTPVRLTSPTFCANAVYGKVLNIPPRTVESPSARSPSPRRCFVTGRPVISPTAIMSPVVSVMMTSPTTSIDTTAASGNVGSPKWNGVTTANQPASPTPDQSTLPMGSATRVPSASPSSTERRARAGWANRSTSTTNSSVPAASARSDGAAEGPLFVIQPAATSMSETPMTRMTVPVTSGGKNRSSAEKNGATRIMNSPHAMVAPKTAVMSYVVPMVIIGPTAANVTPCMSGSRTPNRQNPRDWMIDATPATNRSALMRNARSCAE